MEQNNRVLRGNLKDRLDPGEIYDAAEFLSRYQFNKEVYYGMTGPTVSMAVQFSSLLSLEGKFGLRCSTTYKGQTRQARH